MNPETVKPRFLDDDHRVAFANARLRFVSQRLKASQQRRDIAA